MLTTNDLRICALIKLNLTNKEIVQYENISVRTIETKKYRIKKKLGLDTNTDLNKWIMDL
ncbi:helix-turn-helix transcriptional regulator [Chryseobacterium wanjuense]|uniref:helix-turn-helix transcriptional regulator n=1 Tax=Chryseobacterium wanjuense TaxID=356305 RepID=UPI001E2A1023|nr:LuxR C-terminal-related transcriptional regulator [Chryseobacterium wanjuense]